MSPRIAAVLAALASCLASPAVAVEPTDALSAPSASTDSSSVTLLPDPAVETATPLLDTEFSLAGWRDACRVGPANKAAPTVAVNGFFQADSLWFSQDPVNKAVVGDARDVTDFRRARLSAKGKVADNVDYMMEYDFAFPGRPSFMDVYVDFADLTRFGRLRLGQWRQSFGMDAMTSVKEMMFLERALPFALVPFRQVGVGLYNTAADESITWAISGYRFPTDVYGDAAGDSGYGLATRETMLVFAEDTTTLHLGAGYTYNRPSTDVARLRTPPEVGFNQLDFRSTDFPVPFFVDTGPLAVDSYQAANIELAGTVGPWFAQSEFYVAQVDQAAGGAATFHSGYAQLAYALTGETHPYNRAAGVYSRITPYTNYGGDSGLGAWELAGRWSYIDLTDKGIDGGVLDDLTCGLNWYFNAHMKFQFNYIHAFLDRPAGVNSDADVYAVRAQVDF